jgi:uracil-DNA glycosylase family 4
VDDFLNEVEKFFRFQKALYGPTRFLSAKTGEKADKPVPVKGIEAVSAAAPPEPEPTEQGALADFYKEIHTCTKCALGHSRTKFVFGSGSPDADLMFVGEAPGRDEDLQGKPFVGRAGQLLTLMLQAIDLRREDVFIANVLKCRPPNNRDPLPEEIEQCEPYLLRQIALIKPKLIVALGRFASASLLRTKVALATLRESVHDYNGVPLIVTYHPAALLRNPQMKAGAWEDLKKIRNHLA